MESVLKSLNHLAQVISDDRKVHVNHSAMFLSMLEVGAGFVETKGTHQDPMDCTKNEASTGGKSSRFMPQSVENDISTELDDDDETQEEEILNDDHLK